MFLTIPSKMLKRRSYSQSLEQTEVHDFKFFRSLISPAPSRRINSPYHGTLSSYGYVLLVLYFLIHVKNPPVLPNLQQMSPTRPVSKVVHFFLM